MFINTVHQKSLFYNSKIKNTWVALRIAFNGKKILLQHAKLKRRLRDFWVLNIAFESMFLGACICIFHSYVMRAADAEI